MCPEFSCSAGKLELVLLHRRDGAFVGIGRCKQSINVRSSSCCHAAKVAHQARGTHLHISFRAVTAPPTRRFSWNRMVPNLLWLGSLGRSKAIIILVCSSNCCSGRLLLFSTTACRADFVLFLSAVSYCSRRSFDKDAMASRIASELA